MKASITVGGYARDDIKGTVEFVQKAEEWGVDHVWSAEAWGQDAVTSLAFLAPLTSKIKLGTGIMQISARVPSMTAMTALSLHQISNGRFLLGLGASGPQVVEGLHGADYSGPLTRLKETVDIVRMGLRAEKLQYEGKYHTLPRPGGEGKALRLDHPPTEIPVYLATLAPKSLEYTGAAADGWLGTSFSPEYADAHLDHIRRGAEAAGRTLDDIDLHCQCQISIGENVEEMIDARRPAVAFSMGAMGSANTNFYNAALQRAGFEDDAKAIQKLWIDGKREEAAKRVPDIMVTHFGAVGTPAMVKQRFEAYRDAGINALTLHLMSPGNKSKFEQLEEVMDIIRTVE